MREKGTYYVFQSANTPLKEVQTELPILGVGEILVKINYSTLCGSDLHTYCGLRQEPCPTILGHEIVGTVEEIAVSHSGKDAVGNTLAIGDLITWTVFASDPNTSAYNPEVPQKNVNLFKYGHRQIIEQDNFHGGLASHIIIRPYTYIQKLSKDIPLAIAATINCAIATSAGAIRLAESVKGKSFHIAGLGLLGLVTIAMAKEMGASTIIASDVNPARLELARKFGATHCLNLQEEQDQKQLTTVAIDRFIDMSGSPDAMEIGIESLQLHGVAVFVGAVFKQRKTGIDAEQVIRKMLTLKGLHNYNYEDFSLAVEFITKNWKKYPFTSLVEQEFPLSEINSAITYALEKKPIRVGIFMKNPSNIDN